jgi:H+/Cl- antiporter ClcA
MTQKSKALSRQALRQHWQHNVDQFRHQLAYQDALPQLTILGLISGVLAAAIIVLFRLAIDLPLGTMLPLNSENFEGLAPHWRFLLVFGGAFIIGLLIQLIDLRHRSISVTHVLDRLHNHQGQMPLTNIVVQFVGATLCLITGQSVGREGPAVHLGAGAASQLGQFFELPNNSLRTLAGCGVAAAIAASFNTPMAGVIFAMEVVLMEYTITGFIPVILASVSGAAISQAVFGHDNLLFGAEVQMKSLLEIPFMAFAGLVIAACAAIYIKLQHLFQRFHKHSIFARLCVAGFITGLVAIAVPQVMGLGYDTVAQTMNGQLGLKWLLVIIACKLFVTTLSLGLGMPGGVIGPSLFIGACLGGVMSIIGSTLAPDQAANSAFYVALGMAAMMGAVLNAPLAALMTIVELTYNPNIIFPSMLIIVVACFATRQFFHCEGIFQTQLQAAGQNITSGPAQQILSRVGVRSVMNTALAHCETQISIDGAVQMLSNQPLWLIVESEQRYALRASDLAHHLSSLNQESDGGEGEPISDQVVRLDDIPARRLSLGNIEDRANLYEAQLELSHDRSEALCVVKHSNTSKILGILTNDTINNYYRI